MEILYDHCCCRVQQTEGYKYEYVVIERLTRSDKIIVTFAKFADVAGQLG